MRIQTGDKAPDFELPCCDGESNQPVTLSEIQEKGNTILAFFPLAFTPVCTEELCEFRDNLSDLEELNTSVYGISVDSPFALNAFKKQQDLNFNLLSDFNRNVSESYGVLHEELAGLKKVSKRSIFVIDQEGTVQYSWVTDDPSNKPELEKIKEVLGSLS